jgi:hypothetical protein
MDGDLNREETLVKSGICPTSLMVCVSTFLISMDSVYLALRRCIKNLLCRMSQDFVCKFNC